MRSRASRARKPDEAGGAPGGARAAARRPTTRATPGARSRGRRRSNHHPRALEWYDDAGDAAAHRHADRVEGARAALRAGDWKAVLAAIQALSPEEAREPTWRYWRARAAARAGQPRGGRTRCCARSPAKPTSTACSPPRTWASSPRPQWNGWTPAAGGPRPRARACPASSARSRSTASTSTPRRSASGRGRCAALDDRDLLAARGARAPGARARSRDQHRRAHGAGPRLRAALSHAASRGALRRRAPVRTSTRHGSTRSSGRKAASCPRRARASARPASCSSCRPPRAGSRARSRCRPSSRAMLTQPEVNVQMGTYYFKRVLDDLGDPVLADRGLQRRARAARAAGATRSRSRARSTPRRSRSTRRATT